jgi:hypothetical protein
MGQEQNLLLHQEAQAQPVAEHQSQFFLCNLSCEQTETNQNLNCMVPAAKCVNDVCLF